MLVALNECIEWGQVFILDFLTTYTFPYILSPLVADNIFDLGIYKDEEKQLNQFELKQIKRWGHISNCKMILADEQGQPLASFMIAFKEGATMPHFWDAKDIYKSAKSAKNA